MVKHLLSTLWVVFRYLNFLFQDSSVVLHVLISIHCVDDNCVDPYHLASGSTLFDKEGTKFW